MWNTKNHVWIAVPCFIVCLVFKRRGDGECAVIR